VSRGHCHLALVVAMATALLSAGCASSSRGGAQPAPLLHLVFFHLEDAARVDALQSDCDELLADIPSVLSYASGRHFDVGRDNVDGDYDLFLLVGFDDREGYDAYLVHPRHVELVERWGPELASLRIHDAWAGSR
jgi:hypothetical protein